MLEIDLTEIVDYTGLPRKSLPFVIERTAIDILTNGLETRGKVVELEIVTLATFFNGLSEQLLIKLEAWKTVEDSL